MLIEQEEQMLAIESPLALFISKYLIEGEPVVYNSKARERLKICLKVLAVLVGGSAGIPWINSGVETGKALNSNFVGVMAGYGGLVTYGATSIWVFFELTNLLNQTTKEEKEILLHTATEHKLKIITSQLFGVISLVPTIYSAYIYNDHKYSIAIAALVTYAFGSLGIYKFLDEFFLPIIKECRLKQASKYKDLCLANLNLLIEEQTNAAPWPFEILVGDTVNKNIAFIQFLLKPYHNSKSNKYALGLQYISQAIFPTSNLIFQAVITYHALRKIGFTQELAILMNPFVIVPLYGLDLFSTKRITDLICNGVLKIYKSVHNCNGKFFSISTGCWPFFKKRSTLHHDLTLINVNDQSAELASEIKGVDSSCTFNAKQLRYLIIVIALFLSIFSATTGGYIAYNEMGETIFSPAALFFAISFWLLRLALETNSISNMTWRIGQYVNERYNDRVKIAHERVEKLNILKGLIIALPEENFNLYVDEYNTNTLLPSL